MKMKDMIILEMNVEDKVDKIDKIIYCYRYWINSDKEKINIIYQKVNELKYI